MAVSSGNLHKVSGELEHLQMQLSHESHARTAHPARRSCPSPGPAAAPPRPANCECGGSASSIVIVMSNGNGECKFSL